MWRESGAGVVFPGRRVTVEGGGMGSESGAGTVFPGRRVTVEGGGKGRVG